MDSAACGGAGLFGEFVLTLELIGMEAHPAKSKAIGSELIGASVTASPTTRARRVSFKQTFSVVCGPRYTPLLRR